ncbi:MULTISPECIES: hypothetical protein [unclassified Neisseria]|nr:MULTISPECIES: hypothetical protein [unclassified Neisseria]
MSLAYYTVTPEPELFPKSYIVRIFKDDNLSRTAFGVPISHYVE